LLETTTASYGQCTASPYHGSSAKLVMDSAVCTLMSSHWDTEKGFTALM